MSWFEDYKTLEEALPTALPKGLYMLTVKEALVDYWPDGRMRLDVSTNVADGVHAGEFGPRKTFSFGGYESPPDAERKFVVTAEDQITQFVEGVIIMMNGKHPVTSATAVTEKTLAEIARQLKNAKFLARVGRDAKDYPRINRMYPMTYPPPDYTNEAFVAIDLSKV